MKINIDKLTSITDLKAMHKIIFSFDPTQNIKYMENSYQELMFDNVDLETYDDMLEVFILKISFFGISEKRMIAYDEFEMAAMMRDVRNEITRVYIHFADVLFSLDSTELLTQLNKNTVKIIQDDKI